MSIDVEDAKDFLLFVKQYMEKENMGKIEANFKNGDVLMLEIQKKSVQINLSDIIKE